MYYLVWCDFWLHLLTPIQARGPPVLHEVINVDFKRHRVVSRKVG